MAVLPAHAHHAMGGETPQTALEGFISGLAHPVIGLDHFAVVVAIGLLATLKQRGFVIPLGFVLTSLLGTGLHLMGMDLPIAELVIAASVLLVGVFLALKQTPALVAIATAAAIAGLFHGYAYGEAIVGAGMSPLVAYLAGFTLTQLGVAAIAAWIGRAIVQRVPDQPVATLRHIGFVLCGVGATFLSFVLLNA
ncbi:MAG: hydantoin utilization protein A [Leptolyngbyaceae cyanobacterium SL_7_1]|nr:hydantoin utilization protein A [Leptolyngbyaceae cyanobacterium SL_7_1]